MICVPFQTHFQSCINRMLLLCVIGRHSLNSILYQWHHRPDALQSPTPPGCIVINLSVGFFKLTICRFLAHCSQTQLMKSSIMKCHAPVNVCLQLGSCARLLAIADPPISYLSHDKNRCVMAVQLKSRPRMLAQSFVLHLREYNTKAVKN